MWSSFPRPRRNRPHCLGSSFLPSGQLVQNGVVLALFALVFPIFGAALLRETIPFHRRNDERRTEERPWWRRTRPSVFDLVRPVPARVKVASVASSSSTAP